jgi:hypothetical protein
MPDYTRPTSQWADTAASAVTLTAWSWRYDPVTGEYTLQEGKPVTRAAFVLNPVSGEYELSESVNGEPEVLLAKVGDTILHFI